LNFQGYDSQVGALFKRYDLDKSQHLTIDEFVNIITNQKESSKATSVIGKQKQMKEKKGKKRKEKKERKKESKQAR